MSAGLLQPPGSPSTSSAPLPSTVRRWIIGSRVDLLLILLTPLLAIPTVLLLHSRWVGVQAETISLIVTAFFATGHHLPGLIRAYGDRELFARFRWRFLLAPPLLLLNYFPLYNYHFSLYRLIILFWATWHGLMQLYGFVRIYDSKAGPVSRWTARLDWLICVCGFVTPQVLSPTMCSSFLEHWYSAGGSLISASTITMIRWSCVGFSAVVLAAFAVNYAVLLIRGPKPAALKLLMLGSGIGLWWFALLYIDNLLLGIALFDICHDVQYLAIVWLFNCRRVDMNPALGRFMKYVFRRGMVLLYSALIVAYGSFGLVAPLVLDATVSSIAYAVLFTSTILHYYYDGFIWKVRESGNQASLGLSSNPAAPRLRQANGEGLTHFLKWAPAIIAAGLIFTTDLRDPPLTTARIKSLDSQYTQTLMGKTSLPDSEEEQSWLYSLFERVQNIAAAVPEDRSAQLKAAIMLANFGRNDEAIQRLEELNSQHPNFCNAQLALGSVYQYLGKTQLASEYFQKALATATTADQRSAANLNLGNIFLQQRNTSAADARFKAALQDDPALETTVKEFRQRAQSP